VRRKLQQQGHWEQGHLLRLFDNIAALQRPHRFWAHSLCEGTDSWAAGRTEATAAGAARVESDRRAGEAKTLALACAVLRARLAALLDLGSLARPREADACMVGLSAGGCCCLEVPATGRLGSCICRSFVLQRDLLPCQRPL
jgi:hypothetical protein